MQRSSIQYCELRLIGFQIDSACGPHVIHLATARPDIATEVHIMC